MARLLFFLSGYPATKDRAAQLFIAGMKVEARHVIDAEKMIRYDRWANLASVASVKKAGLADQKTTNIVGHIVGINEMWLARAEGVHSTLAAWPNVTLIEAEEWINRLTVRWLRFLELTPRDLMLPYRDSRGQHRANSLTELVQEVVLHSAHHRGQIALLLRISGHEPPASTDFVPALRGGFF